jgi:YrbI family 3-deoxy-D-manno-octulosonate 8-phosphate phosphatase
MGTEGQGMIAFIPARGGSKGIPGKNVRALCGRPLLYWVLDAATGCDRIEKVYVSTDDPGIARCVEAYGNSRVFTTSRSAATATDTATTESAMIEFAQRTEFDSMVLIQATSPLLRAQHLAEAIHHFQESGADSLVSVVRQKRFTWSIRDGRAVPANYDPRQRPRRQDFEGYLVENGAFYITQRTGLLTTGCRLSGHIAAYEMPEESYLELDEPRDWEIIEALLRAQSSSSPEFRAAMKGIKLLATDVDGVLTDAGMYYSEAGDELKKFNTRDGKAFELMRKQGILTAIITSENTRIVERRAKKLKIDHVLQGIDDKAHALQQLCQKLGILPREVAYLGDDINDLEILAQVGLSACPADAVSQVKTAVGYVCTTNGGRGCVRELVDRILENSLTG